jgi:hypothetical protein
MSMSPRFKFFLLLALIIPVAGSVASTQEERGASLAPPRVVGGATNVEHLPAGPPFTARIEVDTPQPVSYGDDVNISVWITPHRGIDLESIRLNPRGNLSALYQTTEALAKDFRDADSPEFEHGTSCRTKKLSHRPEIPFVATCDLVSLRNGWRQWFDPNLLLDSGRQRFEIEITLEEELEVHATYYEVGSIEFVSPKAAVVLGGFFGALILSLLTFMAKPVGDAPVFNTWKEFTVRFWSATPQSVASLGYGVWDVARRAILGGVTAMVLIILAKSSEGFEAPLSLHIQDFWGGLLVGLVSVHMANWVLAKINSLVHHSADVP